MKKLLATTLLHWKHYALGFFRVTPLVFFKIFVHDSWNTLYALVYTFEFQLVDEGPFLSRV